MGISTDFNKNVISNRGAAGIVGNGEREKSYTPRYGYMHG